MPTFVTTHTDLQAFAGVAAPFLMEDEALHKLMLGATRLMPGDPAFTLEASFLATLHSPARAVTGVASMNPGHNMLLAESADIAFDLRGS